MLTTGRGKIVAGIRMRVKFWGTRGSIAKPWPGTAPYRGNTSCVELRSARGALPGDAREQFVASVRYHDLPTKLSEELGLSQGVQPAKTKNSLPLCRCLPGPNRLRQ